MICVKFDQKIKNLHFGLFRFLKKPKKPVFFEAISSPAFGIPLPFSIHLFPSSLALGHHQTSIFTQITVT